MRVAALVRPRGNVFAICTHGMVGQFLKVSLQLVQRQFELLLHQLAIGMSLANHRSVVNRIHDGCSEGSIRFENLRYVDSEKRLPNRTCAGEGFCMIKLSSGQKNFQVRYCERGMGCQTDQCRGIQRPSTPIPFFLLFAIIGGDMKGNNCCCKRSNCSYPTDRCCIGQKSACGIPKACCDISKEKTPKGESRPWLPLVAESGQLIPRSCNFGMYFLQSMRGGCRGHRESGDGIANAENVTEFVGA